MVTKPPHPLRDAHAAAPAAVAEALGADVQRGLDPAEASDRLARYGANQIADAERFSVLHALRTQLADPLIVLLAAAAALATGFGETLDAAMIVLIVTLNVALGFFQEWRAERALAALSGMLAPHCTVVRGGRELSLDAGELAPGDLLLLKRGERAPADMKLIAAESLSVDESALTGEAHAVEKAPGADAAGAGLHERRSMVFSGSIVVDGKARGVVTATGAESAFGHVAALAASVERRATPLQKRLSRLSMRLGLGALVAALLVAGLGVAVGRPLLDMAFTGVSLAVAAVPEGLPAVVALTLALGVRAMARRNALVRRLRAAEALGSATVICTDKTGTLTAGAMTAVRMVTGAGEASLEVHEGGADALVARALRTAAWCNDARLTEDGAEGEPTERALLLAAQRCGAVEHAAPDRLTELPFSAARKRMLVVVERGEGLEAHVKGAPEFVLPLCDRVAGADGEQALSDDARARWLDDVARLGEEGLRVIALASRTVTRGETRDLEAVEQGLVLLGLVGLMDPPRPRARPAVEAARRAGVRVIMITGDAASTAKAIAREVGLDVEAVLSGEDIDALDDAALLERLASNPVLSRTTPAHKLRVVQVLQNAGEIVAMTGDGVNDAPALKQSDIGVAMGIRGVDAAKAAADLVLLDDDFGTIVDAIREGRRQDESIRNFTRFLLAHNLGEVLTVAVSVAASAPLALTPVQLLWVNLVTDGPMALALGLEHGREDLMSRPPRRPGAPILDSGTLVLVAVFGVAVAAATTLVFRAALPDGAASAQTAAFTAIVIIGAAGVFAFRSLKLPLVELGLRGNPWLPAAVAATIAAQVGVVYAPPVQAAMGLQAPAPAIWALIAGVGAAFLAGPELVKIIRRAVSRR